MKKIIEYTTISGDKFHIFIKAVNDMMACGWQPFGGLSKDFFGCPVQAMVKYEADNSSQGNA